MKMNQVLNQADIQQKVKRMAYQIAENNYQANQIVFIGIAPNGFELAQRLKQEVDTILELNSGICKLTLNKNNPLKDEVIIEGELGSSNNVLILVDDVANTGKTMFYAQKPLVELPIKKLQTAVLVDRQHKMFPIVPDFVGLSLSTTLREHINVVLDKKNEAVFLE